MDKTIYRVHRDKTKGFSIVDNAWINDPRLSAKEKGILLYLLAKPDNWQVYELDIVKHMADGRDSIRTGIKGLISKAYMWREQRRNEGGQFRGYIYHVYEYPLSENPTSVNPTLLKTKVKANGKNRIQAYHEAMEEAESRAMRHDVEAAGWFYSEDMTDNPGEEH